uniref:Uncharacterized protein n=1 Tax=Anguilla anguilla TaxID=7936 RepID=A0A0E9QMS2_ANGAN
MLEGTWTGFNELRLLNPARPRYCCN